MKNVMFGRILGFLSTCYKGTLGPKYIVIRYTDPRGGGRKLKGGKFHAALHRRAARCFAASARAATSRGPLTILTLVKGVITYIVMLVTQGPLHVDSGARVPNTV